MPRLPISVVVITYNCAVPLAACLKSVGFADDILVVDSGSTDGTVEVAQSLGARVVPREWQGFGPQKQFAVEAARHDWVLCLDSDERLSSELATAIEQVLSSTPGRNAYEFPRCNRFLGRYLRHGEGYPDLSLRLFDRRFARWSDDPVHEKVITLGEVGRLEGDLLHDSADTLQAYLAKQNRYTGLAAQALLDQGREASVAKIVLSPLFRFIKFYLVRRGFLDGLPGFIHIVIGCFNSFAKYAKAHELSNRSRR